MNTEERIRAYLKGEYLECTGPRCLHETSDEHFIVGVEDIVPIVNNALMDMDGVDDRRDNSGKDEVEIE